MKEKKLVRITTISRSLKKLLEGQLSFMNNHFEVIGIAAEEKELNELAKEVGFRPYFIPFTRKITLIQDLKCLFILYKFLKKEKPFIVHTHTPKAGIIGMLASKMAGVDYRLHTVAGMPLLEAKGLKRFILDFIEKITYRCATKIYPNSNELMNIIIREKFTNLEKLKVIGNGSSNGIDIDHFDPSYYTEENNHLLKKKYGIPVNDKVLLFIGRLVGDKGINELVATFENLLKKDSSLTLVLVGKMEEDLDPLKEITLNKIQNNPKIILTGYQSDVRPFLAAAYILTFPSYREGFPNVVLQAGAMSLPAIVTNINGCNEIITNKQNGLIIPVKSEEALMKAIIMMIENKELYAKCKETSRKNIIEKYSRKEIWDSLLKEYNNLDQ